ncbi:histidinol phosphate phosphatase [Couchioplanes caeruleus subsp. caeruleus]|uniref:Histidinol phosphate phosphatase n=1 Tax=Couchioplanes caeruleus subsp. caeruleus TaxID=56427 RepID=A0A1K0FBE6_9ACTN|nr:histidinol phosphate phosphatase [Couchioplanes caeruleus subsp. caeruleus]
MARQAAQTGAAVALRHFAALADLPRERKPDGSVVTAADRDTEAAIREVLSAARPADAVLGEEGGAVGDGRRRWIVDPIDGTAQFVAGDDRWLVLVALEVDGEIAVGAAAVPAQGTLWWASRGGGAFRSALDGTAPQRVTVAAGRPDVLDGARLGVVPAPPNYLDTDRRIAAPLAAHATTTEWDVHAPLMVASGGLDLAVQTRGQVWDFAATSLIVTEAGGAYGGVDGIRGPRAGTSLFARSPQLWERAHRALWG